MIPQAKEIEDLATKYSKQQLQQMAQMGQIDPIKAVLAGNLINHIVMANIKKPETTVAEDTFKPIEPPQMGMPSPDMAAAPAPQMGMPSPEMAMAPSPTPMAEGGLASLPISDDMFPDEYAGGGVVAFAAGGMPQEVLDYQKYLADNAKRAEEMREYNKWMALNAIGEKLSTTPGGFLRGVSSSIGAGVPILAKGEAEARALEGRSKESSAELARKMYESDQDRKARAISGSGVTDFDKKWNIYSRSLPPGVKPTLEGFAAATRSDGSKLTYREAARIAAQGMPYVDLSTEEGRKALQEAARQLMQASGDDDGLPDNMKPRTPPPAAAKPSTAPRPVQIPKEGQETKTLDGKTAVFRNGQWVYK